MAKWTILDEPFSYSGGADNSSDVSHGFRFTAEGESGNQAVVNVEAATGGPGMSASQAREGLNQWLDQDELPSRLVMDTSGQIRGPG